MEKVTWLETEFYNKARTQLPFCAIDLLIVYKNTFLLSKRNIVPGKGEWYPVGGRLFRNETLLEGVIRKAHEELGVTIVPSQATQVTATEYINHSSNPGEDRHDVVIAYKISLSSKPSFTIDTTQLSEVAWFDTIDESWHPYLKNILTLAGFNYGPQK